MSQTRRLAAILAADVAGYSRLMGADEEGTHERLKAHLRELVDPKIREHRGRIVKNTGDGFLAEFASVVDAVRCAVEVQRGMIDREPEIPDDQRTKFRIGINLGDVIAEEYDIFGDGVNIAARLEALAEPGGICVSRVVRDQIRDKLDFAFDDMGEQQVKNITRPVRAYRIGLGLRPPAAASSAPVLALPDKPSIAVLPFQNMSGDPEQEYFVDGMVEENTSQNPDPSNSASFSSPARCQVDSLMDCFGLAVHRPLPAGSEVQFLDQTTAACLDNGPVAARSAIRINGTARSSRNSC